MTNRSSNILLKTDQEIEIMLEGGKKLAKVKNALKNAVKIGGNAAEIDKLAEELIKNEGGKPSFKMVPNYFWTTCENTNQGNVHGIPHPNIIFKKGDVVSVDVGMFYKGFHTDTSFSLGLEVNPDVSKFLSVGENALKSAISKAVAGNYIYDISAETERILKSANLHPVRELVGHGVGKDLHEAPEIPCFTYGVRENSPRIEIGAVLAIEIMYTYGSGELVLENDGWTISTRDDKISALFEDTIAVTKKGPLLLTA